MFSSRKIIRSASNQGLSNYLSSLEEEAPVATKEPEDYFQEEEQKKEKDTLLPIPEKKEGTQYNERMLP